MNESPFSYQSFIQPSAILQIHIEFLLYARHWVRGTLVIKIDIILAFSFWGGGKINIKETINMNNYEGFWRKEYQET